jgi:DNA-binding beta-propeller fold protein YncE
MRALVFAKCIFAVSWLMAASTPASAEFRSPFWISPAGHDALEHHVAIRKGSGEVAFVWEEVGAPYTVMGRTLSRTTVLGPTLQLSRPGHRAFHPQVAMDRGGNAYYVWNEWKGGVVTRTVSAGGALGSPAKVANGFADEPQIAINDKGNAVYVWDAFGVQTRTLSSEGVFGPHITVYQPNLDDPWLPSDPQVAVTSYGDAAFCWRRYLGPDPAHNIEVRTLSAGGLFGAVHALNPYYEGVGGCRVKVDRRGNAIILGSSLLAFPDIFATVWARTLSATGVVGPLLMISGPGRRSWNGASWGDLDLDAAGNAVFVWTHRTRASTVIKTRRLSRQGVLGPVQTISRNGSLNPHVALTPDGQAIFTWERFDGQHWRIQVRTGTVQTISDAGRDAHDPDIAVNASGRAVVIGRAFDGSHWRIQGAVTQ